MITWVLVAVFTVVTVAVIAANVWDFIAERRFERRHKKPWYRTW